MPRCLSEGVDIFLKSVERQGGANRMFATGGRCHGWQLEPCPCGLEPPYHFSIENSHLKTRHQGMMLRSPRAFVVSSLTLNLFPNTIQCHIIQCSPTVHIAFVSHTDGQGSVSYLDLRNGGILPVRISSKLEGSG